MSGCFTNCENKSHCENGKHLHDEYLKIVWLKISHILRLESASEFRKIWIFIWTYRLFYLKITPNNETLYNRTSQVFLRTNHAWKWLNSIRVLAIYMKLKYSGLLHRVKKIAVSYLASIIFLQKGIKCCKCWKRGVE